MFNDPAIQLRYDRLKNTYRIFVKKVFKKQAVVWRLQGETKR
jgi:hypothetical protein